MSVNSGNLPEARRDEMMLGKRIADKVERQGADGEGGAAAGRTWAFWRPRWQPLPGSEQSSDMIRLLSKRIALPVYFMALRRKIGN